MSTSYMTHNDHGLLTCPVYVLNQGSPFARKRSEGTKPWQKRVMHAIRTEATLMDQWRQLVAASLDHGLLVLAYTKTEGEALSLWLNVATAKAAAAKAAAPAKAKRKPRAKKAPAPAPDPKDSL